MEKLRETLSWDCRTPCATDFLDFFMKTENLSWVRLQTMVVKGSMMWNLLFIEHWYQHSGMICTKKLQLYKENVPISIFGFELTLSPSHGSNSSHSPYAEHWRSYSRSPCIFHESDESWVTSMWESWGSEKWKKNLIFLTKVLLDEEAHSWAFNFTSSIIKIPLSIPIFKEFHSEL